MTPLKKSAGLCAASLALWLFAGCATTNEHEAANVGAIDSADAKWVHTREAYYRNLGWNALDAHDQAERDLAVGKVSPAEQPHLGRGPRAP